MRRESAHHQSMRHQCADAPDRTAVATAIEIECSGDLAHFLLRCEPEARVETFAANKKCCDIAVRAHTRCMDRRKAPRLDARMFRRHQTTSDAQVSGPLDGFIGEGFATSLAARRNDLPPEKPRAGGELNPSALEKRAPAKGISGSGTYSSRAFSPTLISVVCVAGGAPSFGR